MKIRNTSNAGYTLIETVVYIALSTILLLVVIMSLVTLIWYYSRIVAAKNIDSSASLSIERMTRDFRRAKSVTALSTSPASITLSTTDSSGNPTTVRFFASSTQLYVEENGTNPTPLTLPEVSLSSLSFVQVSTSTAKAVRVVFTLSSSAYGSTDSETFYTAATLR